MAGDKLRAKWRKHKISAGAGYYNEQKETMQQKAGDEQVTLRNRKITACVRGTAGKQRNKRNFSVCMK